MFQVVRRNPRAAVIAVLMHLAIIAFLVVGEDFVIVNAPASIVPLLSYLGLGAHFQSIGRGVIDSRDILYYLSIMVFFLSLNYIAIEQKK